MKGLQMADETKVDAADRKPGGRKYPTGTSGGVAYDVGPQPHVDEREQVYSYLNEKGQEIPDPEPMEPPIGYSNGPSLSDFVQRMIHGQLSKIAEAQEFETFEEADDFEIEDDPADPLTPYEAHFFPQPQPAPLTAKPAEEGGAGGGEPSPKIGSTPPASPGNDKA